MQTEKLAEKIERRREDDPQSMAVLGFAFEESVDPETFCDEVTTTDGPWRLFGIKSKIRDEILDDGGQVVHGEYWKLLGVLCHVEGGETVDASKVSVELWPEGGRIYVKRGGDAERTAAFIESIDDEYGIKVSFGD